MSPLKRIFDLAVALPSLAALSPVLLATAAAVKATGQDVFFMQERGDAGGGTFEVFKFTTMPKGSELLGDITAADDKRPTRLGKLLRKSKINELPQILNVVRGDMSIVGPRPLLPRQVAEYSAEVQAAIAKTRPGLTGLGSLFFAQEDTLLASVPERERFYNEVILPQKGKLEQWYVEQRSIALDARIVALTARTILFRDGSFPPDLMHLVEDFEELTEAFRRANAA